MASVGYVNVKSQEHLLSPHSTADFDSIDPHTKAFRAEDGVVAMTVSGPTVWLALSNGGMEVRDGHSGCLLHAFTAPTARRPSASTRIWCLLSVTDASACPQKQHQEGQWCQGQSNSQRAALAPTCNGEPQVWVGLSTGAIEVYHGERYTLLRQLRKHLSGVYCLAAEQNSASDPFTRVVYSGSSDFQIAQWRLYDGRLLRVFKGHSNYVRCLYAEGSALLSGSDDGVIHVWDRASGEILNTGRFHLQANADNLQQQQQQEQPQQQRRCGISVLCRVGVNMWSGDESGTLIVWRLKDCAALLVSRPHTGRITSLRKIGSQVYSGGADGVICVYTALDGTLAQRLQTSSSSSNCGAGCPSAASRIMAVQCAVEVDRYYLWTGSADNTVRCWHHDEHVAMTEDRERFNDMRWYYATTQPFRESNESLLEQQRELSELVVLSNGSDDAVKAYLSRNDEENQSAAARYWTLERKVRESQQAAKSADEEKRKVEASLALKAKALEVARANLQKMLDAQQVLRASYGMPAASTQPDAGAAGLAAAARAPLATAGMPSPPQGAVPLPPVGSSPAGAAAHSSPPPPPPPPLSTSTVPVIPVAAVPVVPVPSVLPGPPVSATTVATVSTSASPVVAPAPAAVVAPLTVVPNVAAFASAPAVPVSSTAAMPPPGESKVVLSKSYEPDLSSLPPPPPARSVSGVSGGFAKSLGLTLPTAVTVVNVPAQKMTSHGPLSASNSPTKPPPPLKTATVTATEATAPPPPPSSASAPFVVPPPPAAIVPSPPPTAMESKLPRMSKGTDQLSSFSGE